MVSAAAAFHLHAAAIVDTTALERRKAFRAARYASVVVARTAGLGRVSRASAVGRCRRRAATLRRRRSCARTSASLTRVEFTCAAAGARLQAPRANQQSHPPTPTALAAAHHSF